MMQPQKYVFFMVVILFAFASGSVFSQELRMSEIQKQLDAIKKQYYSEPEAAPAVSFLSKVGEVSLADFKGKVVVLNFWATWCTPCVRELPDLVKLQKDYADKEVVIVPVSIDFKGLKTVEPFLVRKLIDLPVYADKKTRLYNAFNANSLPTSVLIDSEGYVRETLTGYVDWNSQTIRGKLDRLL